ncbi:mercuric reductase [Acidipila sp. EB88]|uniref:mercuric reductase n=1 Tax=Acidipila sp. EB88 TaxID=2305226 RepID=UPI000F5E4A6E|nr:mercuric reductase [Acidipila sp. EB88]RRA47335.1 mercuric reductase [Acidipila sp. EB88]
MPQTEHVDALILGSGQAGNPLAAALAAKGRRVVMVESKHVGGTCVNEGCTPTKTMIASAKVAFQARRAAEFGIHTGPVSVNFDEVRDRKRKVVDIWRSGSEKSLAGKSNIELVRGFGRFTGPKTVEVALNGSSETRLFSADLVFINTGLRALTPADLGLDSVPYLDNETVMELDEVPTHLLVLGGSYIAVEFAQMFRRFGADVTIVSNASQLLPREDPDIAEALSKIFEEDGIKVVLNARATAATKTGDGIGLTVTIDGADKTIFGTHLLLAAGRAPNSDKLNLEAAGVRIDEHHFIQTNPKLETSAPGVYALGDVKGGPAFTHISYDDYRIIEANLLNGGARSTTDRPVPYTVFTDPELGRIGMTATEAQQAGFNIRIASMPASSIARAFETGEDRGLVKVVVDRDSEQILGAAILAGEGGELAAMLQIAMSAKLPYPALRDAVWAHPTWAESLNTIFSKWEDS